VFSPDAFFFIAAKSILEEMGKQNPALEPMADPRSPLWNSARSADSAERTTPKGTLLKAIQDKNLRHANLKNMPTFPEEPSLDDIHSALKAYHEPDLFILRVSGKKLNLETCFVNLAVVEASAHRQMESKILRNRPQSFIGSRASKE